MKVSLPGRFATYFLLGTFLLTACSCSSKNGVGLPTQPAAIFPLTSASHKIAGTARYAVTDLGTLGGNYSEANSINNSGQVVGKSKYGEDYPKHAFLYEQGKMQDISGYPTVHFTSGGSFGSEALHINENGIIAGDVQTDDWGNADTFAPTLWLGKKIVGIGTLNGFPGGIATKVNAQNLVLGVDERNFMSAEHSSFASKSFIYNNHKLQPLNFNACDINDKGEIAGSVTRHGRTHVIVRHGSTIHERGTLPPFLELSTLKLNNRGHLAVAVGGYKYSANGESWYVTGHLEFWAGKKRRNLPTLPEYVRYELRGINEQDLIVGEARAARTIPDDDMHRLAVLWEKGQIKDLNHLIPQDGKWVLRCANAINDRGQIVGVGDIGGQKHAFLLTPTAPLTH